MRFCLLADVTHVEFHAQLAISSRAHSDLDKGDLDKGNGLIVGQECGGDGATCNCLEYRRAR